MHDATPSSQPSSAPTIAPLLRLRKVLDVTGLGRSTIYRMMSERTFPAPVRLGKRAVAWRSGDVEQWTLSRPALPAAPVLTRRYP